MTFTPKTLKWFLNIYPPYLFTGTRVAHIASDWKTIIVKIKKSILTRNYVGTTFGGSLYAATDPHYMLMLCQILGLKDYLIWDQSASIYFKKPARSTITFRFQISDQQIQEMIAQATPEKALRPEFEVHGVDQKGDVCVVVKKVLYIKRKSKPN